MFPRRRSNATRPAPPLCAQRLAPVVAADLTHEETLSLDILRRQLGAWIEAPRLHWFSFPVTPYASPIGGVNRAFSTWQFADDTSATAYLELVRLLPGFYGGLRAKLEAQAARGIRIPKPELDLVVPFSAFADRPERRLREGTVRRRIRSAREH